MRAQRLTERCVGTSAACEPLTVDSFRRLDVPGLNPSIRTSQAMAWFNKRLIVGTGRAPLGFLGRFTARDGARLGGRQSDTGGRDEDGAQIVTFDPVTSAWSIVYNSPIVSGHDGQRRARDRSVRAAGICMAAGDRQPCLYLGVGSLEHNFVLLRSTDGHTYEECPGAGFGLDGDVPSVRTIVGWRNRLYSTPTGKNYGRGMFDDNRTDFPLVFECSDPHSGEWVAASEAGFGDGDNVSINEMAVFNDHLYAGTYNPRHGYQVWKTDGAGRAPYTWIPVIEKGAYRGHCSALPSAFFVFNGCLYVGGTIQRQGRGGNDRFGPFPAEMIRIHPDDSWDLVTGAPRFTPAGLKRPLSGTSGGFGDRFVHVFWRMAEYNGYLYLGTAGWRWMPTYLRGRPDLSEHQLASLTEDTRAYPRGAYTILRTADGTAWETLTTTGFPGGNSYSYGIREMTSTPHGLFVAPTGMVGAQSGGGLDLWWGRDDTAEA